MKNKSVTVTRWLSFVASLVTLISLTRCGPGGSATSCLPNVIQAGVSMQVQQLTSGSSVYIFQLCTDMSPAGVFTVYGGVDQTAVSQGSINVSAAARASHLTNSTSMGTQFQVTFQSTDTAFAIYLDTYSGGAYTYSSTTQVVSPHTLPGR